MSEQEIRGEGLKTRLKKLLLADDFEARLPELAQLRPRQAINPLFAFLCSLDERLKWRTVTAMGLVMSRMADENMESARNVMRRFIWNLNDESGGVGWGLPEAMGEILASHEALGCEYFPILFSYVRPDCNPLDNELLVNGVLWGLGRVAQVKPDWLQDCAHYLLPYARSENPVQRGLAVWVLGFLDTRPFRRRLKPLLDDEAQVRIYHDGDFHNYRIGDLAARALDAGD